MKKPTPMEQALQEIVLKHLVAMCEEVKDWVPQTVDTQDQRESVMTPTSAAVVGMHTMLRSCAWSLGSTLASNGVPKGDLREAMLKEVAEMYDDGYSRPGEGKMY